MDEIKKFLRLLKRHRFTIIIIPVISVVITYFLVRNQPNSYLSQARIATGLVDDTQQSSFLDEVSPRGQEITQEFSNIVEMMRMKKILDQVSYSLMIHDLTLNRPFRPLSTAVRDLNPAMRSQLVNTLKAKYSRSEELNLWEGHQRGLYGYVKSMEYDSESLKNKLRINRVGDSDFISVEFESENPELSAFIANSLSSEFIKYYSFIKKSNQLKATAFLKNLMDEKKAALNNAVDSLRSYKIRNRVLNLDEQSSQLYAQIIAYNERKQDVIKSIASNTGALNEIDRKFEPGERKYLESALTRLNQRIVGTRQELQALYDQYIQSNFEEQYKSSIDSLQNLLTAEINKSNDTYAYNPLSAKEQLVQQKLNLEIQLDLSRYSMNSIERELNSLNSQFDLLVPHEAVVQSLDRDIEVASQEYLDALGKYNQSNMVSGLAVKLNLVQNAMPGAIQPSKKMLLVILSGIISFAFCFVVLFLIFFTDHSVLSAKDLANKTGKPVLGELGHLNSSAIDLKEIWSAAGKEELTEFREALRSVRFEIERELKGKVLAVTSMGPSEGKTLLSLSVAYAFSKANRKVLLLDGNFSHPEISRQAKNPVYLEDYFRGAGLLNEHSAESFVSVLSNRGEDTSVLELTDEETIHQKINRLKEQFDLIIIETPSIDSSNQAKEWISFADSVVAVFAAGQTINETKKLYVQYFKSIDEKFAGWVLNQPTADGIYKNKGKKKGI